MKNGKTLMELAAEISRQKNAKKDFLIDTRNMNMSITDNGNPMLELNGANTGALW